MGETYTNVFFYTRQQEELYDPRKYQQLVEGLVALNFYVAQPDEEMDSQVLIAPGVSATIQQNLRDAQEATRVLWMFKAYSLAQNDPAARFSFDAGNDRLDEEDESYGALDLDYLLRVFDESPQGIIMYEHFLQAIRLFYEVYHPVYGYQFDPRDYRPLITRDNALALHIPNLYDLNLFGPELVEQFGRERLESTPAEKVIPLDDGGIMLLPRIFFSPDAFPYSYEEVGKHLGLTYEV
jgi:hypothetical protein